MWNVGTALRAAAPLWLLLAALLPAAAAPQDEPAPPPPDEEPVESGLRESITVSAEHEGVVLGPRGASTSVVEPSEQDGMTSALSEVVAELPGLSENGQGGLFQVVSIRGVSRHRITSMISGIRLTSERRAGVSVSFLDPLLIGSVQVLRGPSTTFFGSGALGGVMQVNPRSFAGPRVELAYGTNGNEASQLFGAGGEGWSAGLSHRRASDGEAADGSRLSSHFDQYSAFLQRDWERNGWVYSVAATRFLPPS